MNQTNQTNHVNETNGIPRWYALRTRSRHEKLVRDQLTGQGVEHLLPTVTRLSQWKDRKKKVEVPLFPGYCFAQFTWQERLSVLKVPGVVQIAGGGDRPEPIPNEEIDALKTLMTSVLTYDAHPYLHEGMVVEVVRGPLEGVRGILLRKSNRYRLVIAVHLIKQAAAVEIDAADVVPVDRVLV
jgi:transcription antitermination factor NusG